MVHLLIIDDNETLREGARAVIKKMGYETSVASSGQEGIDLFKKHDIDMVVTDFKMEGKTGLDVLREVLAVDQDAVVMIMTGYGSVDTAVSAMKEGAFDFIEKPFSPDVLRAKVTAGLALRKERKENEKVRGISEVHESQNARAYNETDAGGQRRVKGIIGDSDAMKKVFTTIEKVARTGTTVYVQGESGTGKELVARAIHDTSPRKDKPFIAVNCAAIPHNLLESELFGHERGAFTGAVKRKLGRFELANEGTIFLDEIGDVPLELQAKLLRAIQERTIERVGGEQPINVDVRIVSATHRDIKEMVKEGTFREDLLYRLLIVPIELPPLRERNNDVPVLAKHFLQKLAPRTNAAVTSFDAGALSALRAYRWPGNVRELENVVEQALVFAEGDTITSDDLPAMLGSLRSSDASPMSELPPVDHARSLDEILEGLEKALILRAYEGASGVKTETARRLGIKTSALYYKLAKYKIGEDA